LKYVKEDQWDGIDGAKTPSPGGRWLLSRRPTETKPLPLIFECG